VADHRQQLIVSEYISDQLVVVCNLNYSTKMHYIMLHVAGHTFIALTSVL